MLQSHTAGARLTSLTAAGVSRRVWQGGVAVVGTQIMTDCSVSYDLSRDVRNSVRLVLTDDADELAPHEPGDLFFTGERFRVEAAVNGAYVQMFEGVVSDFSDAMAGTLAISGEDPLWLCDQAFGERLTLPDDTPAEDAVRLVCEPVLGDSSGWSLDGAGRKVTLRTWAEDDRRLGSITSLMRDLGLELFADRFGQLVLQERPDPTQQDAVVTVREFLSDRASWADLTRSGADLPHNRFVVISDRPDQDSLRATWQVDDPASPLHPDRIGLRTADIYRPDTGAADQNALNAVARQLGIEDSLNLDRISGTAVPDWRLDAGDVVLVRESGSGTDDRYRISALAHPVVGDWMTLQAARLLPLTLL